MTAPAVELPERAKPTGLIGRAGTFIARILLSLFVPIVTFIILYAGFIFLRDSNAPRWVTAIIAIIWGVGGVAALYFVSNWFVERTGDQWRARLQPFVFVGPAVAILVWYLALPAVRTFYASLFGPNGQVFVGLKNYLAVFSLQPNNPMMVAFSQQHPVDRLRRHRRGGPRAAGRGAGRSQPLREFRQGDDLHADGDLDGGRRHHLEPDVRRQPEHRPD